MNFEPVLLTTRRRAIGPRTAEGKNKINDLIKRKYVV
jgi:hypothetical protein